MRILRTLAFTVALLYAHYIADASPVRVSFAGLLDPTPPGDPLDGFAVSGFFVYNDLLGGNPQLCGVPPNGLDCDAIGGFHPVLNFLLNVGPHQFTLPDVDPASPGVFGVLGNQFWGPTINLKPSVVPLGLTALGLATAGSTVELFYTGAFGHNLQQLSFTFRQVASVPEPSALFLAASVGRLVVASVPRTVRRPA